MVGLLGPLPTARRCHRRAQRQWLKGRQEQAQRLAECALDLLRTAHVAPPHEVAGVLLTLGQFAAARADHAQSRRWHAEAADVLRASPVGGADGAVWLSEVLVRLGDGERLAGRYSEALAALQEAAELVQGAGADPVRRAGVLNAEGILAKDTGRHDDAARCYRQALTLLQAVHGADAPLLASLHHNLAGLSNVRGDFGEAEGPARRALWLRQRADPADPAGVAGDHGVLGALLLGQGRYDEAERHLHQALAFWRSCYGPYHYEVAVLLHNLAAAAQGRGDLGTAEDLLRRSARIKTAALGQDHAELGVLHASLARLYLARGDLDAARREYQTALRILDATLGPEHPTTSACRTSSDRLDQHTESVEHGSCRTPDGT